MLVGKSHLKKFLYICMFLLFLWKSTVFLDPDFGWRVRAGEIFLKTGITRADTFSYTMPLYPWVDHGWSVSVIISQVYMHFGMVGLSLLFSSLATITLLMANLLAKLPQKTAKTVMGKLNIPLLCIFQIIFLFFGVRAQIFSWLMLVIELILYIKSEKKPKLLYVFPVLFWVWANLHGSFLMGLIVWSILIFGKSLRERKINFIEIILLVISLIVTLINPYKFGIWQEVFSSVFDSSLPGRIVEWMPAITMTNLVMIFYVAFSSTFVFLRRRSVKLEWLLVYSFMLVETALSRRHLPLWMIISIYPTTTALVDFYNSLENVKFGQVRFVPFYKWIFTIALLLAFVQTFLDANGSIKLSEEKFYPKNAIVFLQNEKSSGRIFTDYAWGGYSIWKNPDEQVFIDGRMPSWKDKNGYKAMDEYIDVVDGNKSFTDTFNKYNIEFVLWPKRLETQNLTFAKFPLINNLLSKAFNKNGPFSLGNDLQKAGWSKIYEDNVASVYSKN